MKFYRRKNLLIACFVLTVSTLFVYVCRGSSKHPDASLIELESIFENVPNVMRPRHTEEEEVVITKYDSTTQGSRGHTSETLIGTTRGEDKNKTAIMNRFIERKDALVKACSVVENRPKFPECQVNDVKYNIKRVVNTGILFCAIQKVSSTYWQRILHIAGGWSNVSNPIEIDHVAAYFNKGGFRDFQNGSWIDVKTAFEKYPSSSVMFVRDPYSKLFSVWLDKYYSPNTFVWKHLSYFVKDQRSNVTKKTRNATCFQDVSFSEFVTFILDQLSHTCVDGHFSPNYLHCMPCNLTYNFIGKYETMHEDTKFLLNYFNLSSKIKINNFETDYTIDAIRDAVNWVFDQKQAIKECGITFFCALYKVWKRLQSRGIISTTFPFPYTSTIEANNAARDDFSVKVTLANQGSIATDLTQNRNESMAQAFHSLSPELKAKFIDIFKIDFELFGYPKQPDFLKMAPKDTKYIQNCPEGMTFE